MSAMPPQITSLTIVYSSVYSGADQRNHQSSASLAIVRGIHRWPVNSLHKGPVARKIFPFDDVIMGFDLYSHPALPSVLYSILHSVEPRCCCCPYVARCYARYRNCIIVRRFARPSHIHLMAHSICLRSADDMTMYCLWRHNWITRRDSCDASTWKAISDSLDIDFIHDHIHDRSCKKMRIITVMTMIGMIMIINDVCIYDTVIMKMAIIQTITTTATTIWNIDLML